MLSSSHPKITDLAIPARRHDLRGLAAPRKLRNTLLRYDPGDWNASTATCAASWSSRCRS
jgi:hypothetical protein